ncbi:STAS domain-containing protein [Fictibacillus phosphorivorans]|uniref:STAS domain-containing protein n=1 Tax=Fictibacillus phosphorivorans TaxID=1221500 RepID=UPI002041EDB0|nr:STAS domain-containing protein [Fictibacillus phosphorivorans]MCM3720233.1 STAS domain-containing protein [Fictibacillus phosphorivorans]MCM3777922.1 STAS domain-containing protein [Fictibacillus phosphorivorans]
MALTLEKEYIDYFTNNREEFQESLLNEARNVRGKIEEILLIGNIDLLSNAHKLVMYTIQGKDEELEKFAKIEGVSWASYSLTIAFKLEWVQAIRRTIWKYLQEFDQTNEFDVDAERFFNMERQINDRIDKFLNELFLSYSEYKDKLIESQKALVEHLSVPIIPITTSVCVLPLIGTVDSYRTDIIEEKVFTEISRLRIDTLIIDFSGIAEMESEVIEHMIKVIKGADLMGCECVITGMRPDIVLKVASIGLSFESRATTKANLQQALEDYIGK